MSRATPLCDYQTIYAMDGTTVTERTKCANDAVGKFRVDGRDGGRAECWLCEDHRDQFDEDVLELIEASEKERETDGKED